MTGQLAMLGYVPIASTPEEFGNRIKIDLERWAKVMLAANIKAE